MTFNLIGFRTSGLRGIPLRRALHGIREAGYNSVEFCIEHPEASQDTLRTARKLGLHVSSVSYHGKRDSSSERITGCSRVVELASTCGVDTVVFGSPGSHQCAFAEELEFVYTLCLRHNLKPCWETEPGTMLDSLAEFRGMIIPLGGKAGINLDAGHLHLQKDCTAECLSSLKDRIHHVHVEGMRAGDHTHLIPGEGDVDWNELLSGLAGVNYSGALVIDLFDLPGDWIPYAGKAYIALNQLISSFRKNIKS